MFDKLIATVLLCGSMGLNLNAEPNRSSQTVEKTLMNSSSYDIHFYHELNVRSHSFEVITTETAEFWEDTFVSIFAEDKPTDVFYWVNQIDNETEVNLAFSDVGDGEFVADLPNLSSDTINGIQFFQRKSLVGETYYLLNGDMSNLANFNSGNLIEDKTATINGRGITSLVYSRTHVDKGLIGFCKYSVNGVGDIANNSRTDGGTSIEELTNIMLYDDGWSNRITFTSGFYPRVYNVQGYGELNPTYFSKEFVGYASRTASNDISISLEPLTVGFDLVALAFSSIGGFLSFMIAPGITLGLLLMVPIILTIILFVLKIIKKG